MGDLLKFERPLPEGGDPQRPCGRCGRAMSRDSVRCRHCGARFDFQAAARRRWPWWMLLGAILASAVVLSWALSR